jgi:hypothetical protein
VKRIRKASEISPETFKNLGMAAFSFSVLKKQLPDESKTPERGPSSLQRKDYELKSCTAEPVNWSLEAVLWMI